MILRKGRIWVLLAVLIALPLGILLRIGTWDSTDKIRFTRDFHNGYYWGSEVMRDAGLAGPRAAEAPTGFARWVVFFDSYVNIYDRVYRESLVRDKDYGLDYPPLRLLIMSLWVKGLREQNPALEVPQSPDVVPLLVLNGVMEMLSAIGMFFLVRLWIKRIRSNEPDRKWKFTPDIIACGAALLVWFNPACLLNSNGWPQWDVWIMPFFIFAALAGSHSRWLLCGLLLGTAAFLKGQILIVSAFFPFWALFAEGRYAGLRVLTGWLAAFVGIASPWLLEGFASYVWIIVIGAFLIPVTWLAVRGKTEAVIGVLLGEVALLIATGLLAHGSFTWLEIGFHYGSNRYMEMFSGAVYNIPASLAGLGWNLRDPLLSLQLAPGWQVDLPSVRFFLRMVYVVMLILAAYAMAYHARRRSPEVLLAMALPWLLMFALLGQMHERYLLWGAVMSAAAAILRPSLFLLYAILSAGTCCMILTVMLKQAYEETLPPGAAFLDWVGTNGCILFSLILAAAVIYVIWRPVADMAVALFSSWGRKVALAPE